jgi:hypothetical protein
MVRTEHALHRHRVDRGLSLEQIVGSSLLPASIVRKIDEGRFEELPAGIYARSYVRAFATAVGIEPDRAVAELAERLPEAPDPFPVLRELKIGAESPLLMWRLPQLPHIPWRVPQLAHVPRWAAAVVDALMLLVIDAVVVRLVAYACGLPVHDLLQHASAAVAMVCTVPMTLYFVLFEGIGGRTPGAILCKMPEPPPSPAPLGLRMILLRAVL